MVEEVFEEFLCIDFKIYNVVRNFVLEKVIVKKIVEDFRVEILYLCDVLVEVFYSIIILRFFFNFSLSDSIFWLL